MRTVLLFIFFSIAYNAGAQDSLLYNIFPMKDGAITYEKVIQADSIKQPELYNRAKAWALSFYNSQKDALQSDDKQAGTLAYRGFFAQTYQPPSLMGTKPYAYDWNYWETIKIFTKDGKAKIIISDIMVKPEKGGDFRIEAFNNFMDDIYRGTMKKYRKKSEDVSMENFRAANLHFQGIIQQLESQLASKKKSESDF